MIGMKTMGRQKRSNPHRPWRFVGPLLIVGFMGCSGGEKEQEPVVAVQAAEVRQGAIQRIVSAEAVLFALHDSAITPKVSAPVKKCYVNRGSKVHAGELLAWLEHG